MKWYKLSEKTFFHKQLNVVCKKRIVFSDIKNTKQNNLFNKILRVYFLIILHTNIF